MDNLFKVPEIINRRAYKRPLSVVSAASTHQSTYKSSTISNTTTTSGIVLLNNSSAIPLAKEIETRLEVVSKVVPQEEVYKISEEYINKLNAVFFQKVADQLQPTAPPSVSGSGGVQSHNIRSSNQMCNGNGLLALNNDNSRLNSTATRLFKAAKEVQKSKNLTIISEINEENGLYLPRKENSSAISKGRPKKPMKILEVLSSQNSDNRILDFNSVQPPSRSTKAIATKKTVHQTDTSTSRRKKSTKAKYSEVSIAELTITKNSLRNSSVIFRESKTKTVTKSRGQKKSTKAREHGNLFNELSQESSNTLSSEDESEQVSVNDTLVQSIRTRPKKTALSPFYNRLQPRFMNASSTPLTRVN